MNEHARYEVQPKSPLGIVTYHFKNHPKIWRHWHEYLEIIYLIKGRIEVKVNKKTSTAKSGDIIVFNCFETHESSFMSPENEYVVFVVPPEFIGRENNLESYFFSTVISNDSSLRDVAIYASNGVPEGENHADFFTTSKVFLLLHHLVSKHSVIKTKGESVSEIESIVNDLKTRISFCYAERLNISMLANSFGISKSYLRHIFKNETGVSIIDYINQTRIDNAVLLLDSTELRISSISEAVGFLDYNYFSRVFKKYIGVSPSVYRNKNSKTS